MSTKSLKLPTSRTPKTESQPTKEVRYPRILWSIQYTHNDGGCSLVLFLLSSFCLTLKQVWPSCLDFHTQAKRESVSFKSTKSGTIKTTKFDYFCYENHSSKVKNFDKNKGIKGRRVSPSS